MESLRTLPIIFLFIYSSETCLNQTLNKVPMQEIIVNLTCIDQTPVYSEHKSWSQGGLVQSECLLFNANSAIFQLYHGQNKLIFNEMIMRSPLYQTNGLGCIFIYCQLTETTVCGQTCCATRTHYPDSEPTSLCSFSLMLHVSREATNINLIVFGFT